jgi:hypothetical protein
MMQKGLIFTAGWQKKLNDLYESFGGYDPADFEPIHEAPTSSNDVLMGALVAGVWTWIRQTIAQLKTTLGLTGTNSGDQTITLTGDVTGTGTGSFAATIAAAAVTLAKMANMATASLIYRKTAGDGAPEVQTLATLKTDLGLTGTNSGDQTITLTGDVTGSGVGSFAATIAAKAVTLAKMDDMATASLFYRKTALPGIPEVNSLATLKTDLSLTGTNSGNETTTTLAATITGSTADTPLDADEWTFRDAVDAVLKKITWANIKAALNALYDMTPPGTIALFSGISAPAGWLLANGASTSRAANATLWATLYSSKGTCTISNGSPAVVTFNGHGFLGGERIFFTTTAALPAGLTANLQYWVGYINANTFNVYATYAAWVAATPKVNTTDGGGGVHTLVYAPWGVPDASNFYLPDLCGISVYGAGTHGANNTNGIMKNANAVAFVGALGVQNNDKIQNITGKIISNLHATGTIQLLSGNGAFSLSGAHSSAHPSAIIGTESIAEDVDFSAANSANMRTGAETNPARVGINYIIKT